MTETPINLRIFSLHGLVMTPRLFKNLQGILFDLGGTLDADGEHWLNRFYLLYQEYLPEVAWEELKTAFYDAEAYCLQDPRGADLNLAGLIDLHVSRQLAVLKVERAEIHRALVQKFLASCLQTLHRNAGILSRLAQRFRLGVVTNSYGNAARVLAEAGSKPSLMALADSHEVGVRKPDAAIFRLALRRLDLAPEVVAYVGDSYNQDIRPARQVGLVTIWLRNDAMSAPLPPDFDPALADYQISSLGDLEGLLS